MIEIEAPKKLFAFHFSDCSGHVIHASADVANANQAHADVGLHPLMPLSPVTSYTRDDVVAAQKESDRLSWQSLSTRLDAMRATLHALCGHCRRSGEPGAPVVPDVVAHLVHEAENFDGQAALAERKRQDGSAT